MEGDETLGLVRGMQDLKMQAIQKDEYNQVEAGQNPNKVSSGKGEEEYCIVRGMQNLKMQTIQEGKEEDYSEGEYSYTQEPRGFQLADHSGGEGRGLLRGGIQFHSGT